MALIIDFCKELRKQDLERVLGQMNDANNKVTALIDEYYKHMLKDSSAIDELHTFVYKMRNVYGNSAYEAFAGGPNHDNIAPLFNILGWAYPHIKKQDRIKGLTYIMGYLNGLRYDYSQNHVELINEPWLAADIVTTNFLYWPGYKYYIDRFQKYNTWKEFSEKTESIPSHFWMTMTVLRPKYASLDIRKSFYEQFPILVDRTLDAVASISHAVAISAEKKENQLYNEAITEEIQKYDPLFHSRIREKLGEKKWIRLDSHTLDPIEETAPSPL